MGYRYFDTYGKPVLFPFGYGLSYSEFVYSDLSVLCEDGVMRVCLCVENISKVSGKEVVQVYIGSAREGYPLKELKAFEKVPLKAHEKKKICINIALNELRHFVDGEWRRPAGEYTVYIGKNVSDIQLSAKINI